MPRHTSAIRTKTDRVQDARQQRTLERARRRARLARKVSAQRTETTR